MAKGASLFGKAAHGGGGPLVGEPNRLHAVYSLVPRPTRRLAGWGLGTRLCTLGMGWPVSWDCGIKKL